MAKAKKLPSGNWRVRVKKNGVVKSFTSPDKKSAELLAMEWQLGNSEIENTSATVKQCCERYIESKSKILSPNTIHNYKMMKDNYLQSIMNYPINKLKDEQIQIAINELSLSRSPKTVRNAYGLLTAVLRMFRPSYTPRITLPQKEKKEIIIPERKQIEYMLNYAKDKNIYIPIILAAYCGLREAEICALTSNDVKNGKIHVNKSLVFNDDTKEWIVKLPKSFAGNRYIDMPNKVRNVVEGKTGKIVDYTPDGLRMTFKKLMKKLDISNIRFHDLRHFYVSELFDMGLPEKYIIAQVGHSSASITKAVYDHLSIKKQSEYAEQIANHFDF